MSVLAAAELAAVPSTDSATNVENSAWFGRRLTGHASGIDGAEEMIEA
jgi:hypothetical protein